jgi:hypothetical protein
MNPLGEGVKMGRDVTVWHFTYIGDETVIGDGTSIGSLSHVDHETVCRVLLGRYLGPLGIDISDSRQSNQGQVTVNPGVVDAPCTTTDDRHVQLALKG